MTYVYYGNVYLFLNNGLLRLKMLENVLMLIKRMMYYRKRHRHCACALNGIVCTISSDIIVCRIQLPIDEVETVLFTKNHINTICEFTVSLINENPANSRQCLVKFIMKVDRIFLSK